MLRHFVTECKAFEASWGERLYVRSGFDEALLAESSCGAVHLSLKS